MNDGMIVIVFVDVIRKSKAARWFLPFSVVHETSPVKDIIHSFPNTGGGILLTGSSQSILARDIFIFLRPIYIS